MSSNKPLKILLVYQHYLGKDQPGISRFNQFVQHWSDHGHQVDVLTGSVNHMTRQNSLPVYQVFKTETDKDSKKNHIYVCRMSNLYGKGYAGRMIGYVSFILSAMITLLVKRLGPYDAVICSSPPLTVGLLGVVAAKFTRSPLFFEIRDLWPESAVETGVITNKFLIWMALVFEKMIYRHATKIGVVIPSFIQHLVDKKKVPEEKIFYLPNGADFNLLAAAEEVEKSRATLRKQFAKHNELLLVYAGAHNLANNLHQLLPVAKSLENEGVKFILVGDGNQKKSLQDEADVNNMRNIIFLDPMPKSEVLKLISACDLGLSVLKKADIFKAVYSNKTFDYLSCKVPALVFIDGLSRKLVEEHQCGFYSPPEDSEKAIEKILQIKSMDRKKLQQMGIAGYELVKNDFDRKILAGKYLEVIKGN